MNNGKRVWNVQPKDAAKPFQVTCGELFTDENGVHLGHPPGDARGLYASFPLGTLIWREDVVSDSAKGPPAVEVVAGELAQFDLSPRIEIGAINISGGADPQGVASMLRAFLADLPNIGPIR